MCSTIIFFPSAPLCSKFKVLFPPNLSLILSKWLNACIHVKCSIVNHNKALSGLFLFISLIHFTPEQLIDWHKGHVTVWQEGQVTLAGRTSGCLAGRTNYYLAGRTHDCLAEKQTDFGRKDKCLAAKQADCLAGRTCGCLAAKQAVWQEGQVTGRKDKCQFDRKDK